MKFYLFVLLFSVNTFGSEWLHLKESQNDVNIHIDYKNETIKPSRDCYKCPLRAVTTPLYVNVSGPGVKGKQNIRVIITSIQQFDRYSLIKASYALDLNKMPESHFSGEFSEAKKMFGDTLVPLYDQEKSLEIYTSRYGGEYIYRQNFAVVIDGVWLKDFSVNLRENYKY